MSLQSTESTDTCVMSTMNGNCWQDFRVHNEKKMSLAEATEAAENDTQEVQKTVSLNETFSRETKREELNESMDDVEILKLASRLQTTSKVKFDNKCPNVSIMSPIKRRRYQRRNSFVIRREDFLGNDTFQSTPCVTVSIQSQRPTPSSTQHASWGNHDISMTTQNNQWSSQVLSAAFDSQTLIPSQLKRAPSSLPPNGLPKSPRNARLVLPRGA